MVGQAAFQTAPGLSRGFALGDLGLVVDVAEAAGRPDLGDRDDVERGIELTIPGTGTADDWIMSALATSIGATPE